MNNDFSSIDKLMEFGLGLAISQQMISTMNHAVNNVAIPGLDKTRSDATSPQKAYYAIIDSRQTGPLLPGEVSQLIGNGKITKETLMWCAGMSGWTFASGIPEINKYLLLLPPPIPEQD
ncbi:MAG: DUF4339 domain-containing protein [Tannerella sp.]|jgi:hypothetical protein|nr:DUF4339 domain-containing protein [Tannerella sp.]